MVEFIRDVVVVLALLLSLFAVAYRPLSEAEGLRGAAQNTSAPDARTVAPATHAASVTK